MKICIGSTNKVKVEALKETLQEYPHLKNADILSVNVPSGVADQPKTLEETVRGAMNRAKNAFNDCAYSVGMESGIMAVPHTKSGFMNVDVCAIYDGKEFHLGLSPAWEAPAEVVRHMLDSGLNMNDAAFKAGLTADPAIGASAGLVGVVSKGRIFRKECTQFSIRTALIHLENL